MFPGRAQTTQLPTASLKRERLDLVLIPLSRRQPHHPAQPGPPPQHNPTMPRRTQKSPKQLSPRHNLTPARFLWESLSPSRSAHQTPKLNPQLLSKGPLSSLRTSIRPMYKIFLEHYFDQTSMPQNCCLFPSENCQFLRLNLIKRHLTC